MISKPPPFFLRVGAVLLCLLISAPLQSQAAGAVLSGAVTDASGKTIPDARIVTKNVATGQVAETQTDRDGRYDALNLAPGDYEISVSAPGFTTKVTRVTITASGRQTINLTLRGLLSLEDLGFAGAQAQGARRTRPGSEMPVHVEMTWRRQN